MLDVTPTIRIAEHELHERFVRASGPGGQNVNKVSTAVELRFHVLESRLPPEVQARLIALAGKKKIGAGGVLLIDSREHRTQAQNRAAARARLVELVRQAATRPRPRTKTKPTRTSRERRIASKVLRSRVKEGRGRVRAED